MKIWFCHNKELQLHLIIYLFLQTIWRDKTQILFEIFLIFFVSLVLSTAFCSHSQPQETLSKINRIKMKKTNKNKTRQFVPKKQEIIC